MRRRRRPRLAGGAAGVGWPSRSRGRRWLLAAWSAPAAAPDLDPGGLLRPHPSSPAADSAVSGSRASGRPVDVVREDLGGGKPPVDLNANSGSGPVFPLEGALDSLLPPPPSTSSRVKTLAACGQATAALRRRYLLEDATLGWLEGCGCASSYRLRLRLCGSCRMSLVVGVWSPSRSGCCGSPSGGAVGLLASGGAPLGRAEMRSPLRQCVRKDGGLSSIPGLQF